MVAKTLIAIAIFALAAVWMVRMPDTSVPLTEKTVRIGNASLAVEVADTLASQTRGLSGRETLAQDRGMLFVYDDVEVRNFWMKDMRFPLDVLWIADNKVAGMEEHIPFESEDGSVVRFKSDVSADMVLEVNSGWIAEHGVKTGDAVKLDMEAD